MAEENHNNFISSLPTAAGCIRFFFALCIYLAAGIYLYSGRVDFSNINSENLFDFTGDGSVVSNFQSLNFILAYDFSYKKKKKKGNVE